MTEVNPPEPTEPTEPTGAVEPTAAAESTPAAVPPPAPPVAAAGGWGPPGQTRSWGTVAILWIITCGIYGIFWQYYMFRDMKEHTGEGIGGGLGVVFAIFLPVVNIFLLPAEVGNMYAKAGQEKPVTGPTGFWNLIPLVGFFIWLAKVQNAVNARWEQSGASPA